MIHRLFFFLSLFATTLFLVGPIPFSGPLGCSKNESSDGSSNQPSPSSNPPVSQAGPIQNTFPTIAGVDFSSLLTAPDPALPITGKIWYVATTGSDSSAGSSDAPLKSIVTAVSQASPGDKIIVKAGTYAEGDSDTGKGISISKNGLTLTSATGETVVITPASGITYGINITGDNTTLNGFTIQGFSTVAIELGGKGSTLKNIILMNLIVKAAAEGIINYEDLGGTTATINKLLLQNVVISGAQGLGFSCNAGPCTNVRLNNVTVSNRSTGAGNSGSDCIAFERGDNLVFFNVESTGCEADGLDLKATRVAVVNSYFHDLDRNGLKLWRGGDVINTSVSTTGADGAVIFDGPGNYRMLNSSVTKHLKGQAGAYTMTVDYDTTCGGTGKAANFCCSTSVANNCGPLTLEFTNNVFTNDSGPIFVPSGTGLTMKNNLFAQFAESDAFLEVRDLSGLRISTASEISSRGFGSNNLSFTTDPGPSVLINAGTIPNGNTFPSFDALGKPRTQGGAPDLGPVENQ